MYGEGEYYQPPRKSPVPAAVIASIITTVALYFGLRALDERGLFPWLASGRSAVAAGPVASVEVPSVVGMRPEQARELLKGRDLLLTLSGERDDGHHPAGTIADQSPLLGSQVLKGTAVQATLSRGLKLVPVPDVAGAKAEDAARKLAAAGLGVGPPKTVASDTVPAGMVVATEPAAAAPLAAQTAVTLVVSSGAAAKPIPKVIGMYLRPARELLEQQGFKVGKIRYGSDDDRNGGVVLSQKPPLPVTAPPGTVVDLVVNED